jgi:hypothetical protein
MIKIFHALREFVSINAFSSWKDGYGMGAKFFFLVRFSRANRYKKQYDCPDRHVRNHLRDM